jgi:hypothetical protein
LWAIERYTDVVTLRRDFDRQLMLEFCGSGLTFDAGLLAYSELDRPIGCLGRPRHTIVIASETEKDLNTRSVTVDASTHIARQRKRAPHSSSLIEIAAPKVPLLYRLQNNRVMA